MVTLTIDNQTVRVAEGTTILEAAKSAGIIIPICATSRSSTKLPPAASVPLK